MKECPFCAEEIQDEGIKCKHCGEWLGKKAQACPQGLEAETIEPPETQPQIEGVSQEVDEEIKRKNEALVKQCPYCGSSDLRQVFLYGAYKEACHGCKRVIESGEHISAGPQKEGKDTKCEVRPDQIKPWLRFWARYFDYTWFMFILCIMLYLISPSMAHELFSKENKQLFGLMLIFLWNFIEAGLIVIWGTTLGKWLLSISVHDQQDSRLNYNQSLGRVMRVYWRGMGIGFPIVNIITQIIAYRELKQNGKTTWDRDSNVIVHHGQLSIMKIVFMVFGFGIIICLIIAGNVKSNY